MRLSLTSVGLLQYIAPTITLAMAVILNDEPFDRIKLISFSCIWIALLTFSVESYSYHNKAANHEGA